MTTNYHTPITVGAAANVSVVNNPLAQLDEEIGNLALVEKDGHIIQDEGVDLAQQQRINFTGSGVRATDTPGVTVVDVAGREVLTAARTYYVRTDGSDSNTGLANTAGGAFLTAQKAINEALNLDARTYQVTIQIGPGTRTAGMTISAQMTGTLPLIIIGDNSTPANCKITTTAANCFTITGGATVTISGFQPKTINSGNCLDVELGSVLIGYMTFDESAGFHQQLGEGATVTWFANYSIIGGAVGHCHTSSPCTFQTYAITVTLTGTPAWGSFGAGAANGGTQYWANVTFSGSATGQRYYVHKNGVIDCGGGASETFLPGTSNCGVPTT